jgi:general secretion pathway protein L
VRIAAVWKQWIEVLAAAVFSWREMWRARRSLVVARDEGRFIVRQARSDRESIVVTADMGSTVSEAVARTVRKSFVILEFPLDKIVLRRISVPAQAREYLAGIVRNQIERLSPWQADQSVYGFDAEISPEDATALNVRVLIAARADIDGARDEVAAIGLAVDRVVAGAGAAQATAPVTLWSRIANTPHASVQRACWQIGLGIAATVSVSFGLCLWAIASAASIRAESENLAAHSKTLQRQIQSSATSPTMASLNPAERAWIAKGTSRSAVIVLEALSRTVPDTAYLTELYLENATLRLVGLAGDPPSLIAPLEQSGHLADVHFFAPTTRGGDGKLFRFHIEARVEPRLTISGN